MNKRRGTDPRTEGAPTQNQAVGHLALGKLQDPASKVKLSSSGRSTEPDLVVSNFVREERSGATAVILRPKYNTAEWLRDRFKSAEQSAPKRRKTS